MTGRGATVWAALVGRLGPPSAADLLHDEDQQAALTQHRVLVLEVRSDGFGSGDVCLRVPTGDAISPPLRSGVVDHVQQIFLVFPRDMGLTDHERASLASSGANPWERAGDVPHLERLDALWGLLEWVGALRMVCPGYAPRLSVGVLREAAEDPRYHERVVAAAIEADLVAGAAAGAERVGATLEVVARRYPSRLQPEGPRVLLADLRDWGLAQGADALQAVDTLLPAALRRLWEDVLTERLAPPHDGFW